MKKPTPTSQVVLMKGAGLTAESAADALNALLRDGFIIHSFQAICGDLVVLYSEPFAL